MFESFLQEPIIYRMVGVPTTLLVDQVDFRVLNVKTGDNRIVSKSKDFHLKNISIYSVKKTSTGGLNLKALGDVLRLLFLAVRVVNRGDINHCRAHGGAAVGLLMKILRGNPYIFDYRGSVIEEREELSNRFSLLVRAFLKFGERLLLRNCDQVICVSHSMAKHLLEVHGVEAVVIQNPTLPSERVNAITESQGFTLIFLGSATPWHEIENFKHLVQRLSRLDIQLHVKVLTKDIAAFDWLQSFQDELFYEVKSVSPIAVHDEVRGANLGYCLIRPSFSKSICMPVKFAEFISANVPVVVNKGIGDLERIVREYNLGLVINKPSDVKTISIKNILGLKEVKIDKLPEVLDWNFMKYKWLEIYEELTSSCHKNKR